MKKLVWLVLVLLVAAITCSPSGCGQRTETERTAAIELQLANAEPGDIIIWENPKREPSFIDMADSSRIVYSDLYGKNQSRSDPSAIAPGIKAVLDHRNPMWEKILRELVEKYHPRN